MHRYVYAALPLMLVVACRKNVAEPIVAPPASIGSRAPTASDNAGPAAEKAINPTRAVEMESLLPVHIGDEWVAAKASLLQHDPTCQADIFAGIEQITCHNLRLDLGFMKVAQFIVESLGGALVTQLEIASDDAPDRDCAAFPDRISAALRSPWKVKSLEPASSRFGTQGELARYAAEGDPRVDQQLEFECRPPSLSPIRLSLSDGWTHIPVPPVPNFGQPETLGNIVPNRVSSLVTAGSNASASVNRQAAKRMTAQVSGALSAAEASLGSVSAGSAIRFKRFHAVATPAWIAGLYKAEQLRQTAASMGEH
jgi:hypothetical protein